MRRLSRAELLMAACACDDRAEKMKALADQCIADGLSSTYYRMAATSARSLQTRLIEVANHEGLAWRVFRARQRLYVRWHNWRWP